MVLQQIVLFPEVFYTTPPIRPGFVKLLDENLIADFGLFVIRLDPNSALIFGMSVRHLPQFFEVGGWGRITSS